MRWKLSRLISPAQVPDGGDVNLQAERAVHGVDDLGLGAI